MLDYLDLISIEQDLAGKWYVRVDFIDTITNEHQGAFYKFQEEPSTQAISKLMAKEVERMNTQFDEEENPLPLPQEVIDRVNQLNEG